MTLDAMKAFPLDFSTLLLAASLAVPGPLMAATPGGCGGARIAAPVGTADPMTYPTFCSIPKAPTDVKSAAAFRTEILATRIAGRDLVRAEGAGTFGLSEGGAKAFAATARAEAAPPPPMSPQDVADAEAFAREARAQATPPTRPH